MTKRYEVIYADPPWNESGGGKIKRGADRHYPLMKTNDIIALGFFLKPLIAENAHCYLWVTNNFLLDGLEVLKSWGFRYVTMITWVKDRIGLGQYFRGQTEHCLFGVKGNLPYKIVDEKRQQGTTVIIAPRTIHSRKPKEMREMIERVSNGENRLELFARQAAKGWDIWGNELPNSVEIGTKN